MSNKYIFLDRDGVINHDSKEYIKSADEWVAIDGSLEAIALLTNAGYRIILITNQAGLAKNKFKLQDLEEIHAKLHKEVKQAGGEIFDLIYCPHHPDDNCKCRKPEPGMMIEMAKKHDIDISLTCMVGDSIKDMQAVRAFGASPHYVLTSVYKDELPKELSDVPTYFDLLEFTKKFLNIT